MQKVTFYTHWQHTITHNYLDNKIKFKLFSPHTYTDTSLILFVPAHSYISTLACPYSIASKPELYIYTKRTLTASHRLEYNEFFINQINARNK